MRWRPRSLAFVAHLDHITAHIMAALGADGMRGHRCAALRAKARLLGLLVMMAPAATVREFEWRRFGTAMVGIPQ